MLTDQNLNQLQKLWVHLQLTYNKFSMTTESVSTSKSLADGS